MKIKSILVAATAFLSTSLIAQSDSANTKTDTITVGNFVIIKKEKSSQKRESNSFVINWNKEKNKKNQNISTNWFIFDLGFANYRDETDYAAATASNFLRAVGTNGTIPQKDDFKLISGKSSNVNIWLFMQKLNVTKHVLNLKYGLGLEMYNLRYSSNISFANNPTYIFKDSINFSKNKLYAGYLTVPLMVNIDATPSKRRGFNFSAGVSAGYLVGSRTKQISGERGKDKNKSNFNLNPWRLAAVAEAGIGPVRVYGSYSFNELMENGLKQYPYAIGIRFSNW